MADDAPLPALPAPPSPTPLERFARGPSPKPKAVRVRKKDGTTVTSVTGAPRPRRTPRRPPKPRSHDVTVRLTYEVVSDLEWIARFYGTNRMNVIRRMICDGLTTYGPATGLVPASPAPPPQNPFDPIPSPTPVVHPAVVTLGGPWGGVDPYAPAAERSSAAPAPRPDLRIVFPQGGPMLPTAPLPTQGPPRSLPHSSGEPPDDESDAAEVRRLERLAAQMGP